MDKELLAVRWLRKKLNNKLVGKISLNDWDKLQSIFIQAEKMEEDKLLEAWNGGINSTEEGGKSFDKYYNKNYEN